MNSNPFNEHDFDKLFRETFGKPLPEEERKPVALPGATAALVLGIISVFSKLVRMYWLGPVTGLVCGVIAVVIVRKAKKLCASNPATFTPRSILHANAGFMLGVAGLILSALDLLPMIVGKILFL